LQFSGRCLAGTRINKRWNSAADFSAIYPHRPLEPRFRQNVWQSGARNRTPKTDEFPVPATPALIGGLMGFPEKV
jgi:hypothetical protein